MAYKLSSKDSHTLSPVEEMPQEIVVGSRLKLKSAIGAAELVVTGLGSGRRQAYFKGQPDKLKSVLAGATKEAPVEVDVEVLSGDQNEADE